MAHKGHAFVINLDDKNSRGTHWTCARLVDDTLYYADPVGTLMNGWPPKSLEDVAEKIITNNITFQRPASDLCGYYSICFCQALNSIDKKRPLNRKQFVELLYRSIL